MTTTTTKADRFNAPLDTTMSVEEKMQKVRDLMDENGLAGWKLALESNLYEIGRTALEARVIFMSKEFAEVNPWEIVRETALHEIAHAIVDDRDSTGGHTEEWERVARGLGHPNPKAFHDEDDEDDALLYPFSRETLHSMEFASGALIHQFHAAYGDILKDVVKWYPAP